MEGADLPDHRGAILSYVNAMFIGAAPRLEPVGTVAGLIAAALIIPVFCYRHYIKDKGKFPIHMLDDIGIAQSDLVIRKAGILPYLTLAAGFGRGADLQLAPRALSDSIAVLGQGISFAGPLAVCWPYKGAPV